MEKFSRERQRAILVAARGVFPHEFVCANGIAGVSATDAMADIRYLEGHSLLTVLSPRSISLRDWEVSVRITSKGIDFLEDDGGLAAILGVITVRLHDDTIKSLIEAKIEAADLPPPDKRRYLDALRELPAESTKHLAMKLIDAGLANVPAAWNAIQSTLSAAL